MGQPNRTNLMEYKMQVTDLERNKQNQKEEEKLRAKTEGIYCFTCYISYILLYSQKVYLSYLYLIVVQYDRSLVGAIL